MSAVVATAPTLPATIERTPRMRLARDTWLIFKRSLILTIRQPVWIIFGMMVPVLYLVGSQSPASSRAVARLLTRTLPRVTAVEIEGVGHMAPVTHPERVNALIERHLERV